MLLTSGIYKPIASPLKGGEWRNVSLAMLGLAIAAEPADREPMSDVKRDELQRVDWNSETSTKPKSPKLRPSPRPLSPSSPSQRDKPLGRLPSAWRLPTGKPAAATPRPTLANARHYKSSPSVMRMPTRAAPVFTPPSRSPLPAIPARQDPKVLAAVVDGPQLQQRVKAKVPVRVTKRLAALSLPKHRVDSAVELHSATGAAVAQQGSPPRPKTPDDGNASLAELEDRKRMPSNVAGSPLKAGVDGGGGVRLVPHHIVPQPAVGWPRVGPRMRALRVFGDPPSPASSSSPASPTARSLMRSPSLARRAMAPNLLRAIMGSSSGEIQRIKSGTPV